MKVVKAAKGATRGSVSGVGGSLGGASSSRATMTKRLNDFLPGVSPTEILRHESWYRLRSLHLAKKRAEKQVMKLFLAEYARRRNKVCSFPVYGSQG